MTSSAGGKRGRVRIAAVGVTVAMLAAATGVAAPLAAAAAGTVLFENSFANRTVDGTGTVTVPTPTSGTNVACLTASGNSATLPLLSCPGTTDAQGSGKLRLTNASGNQVGGVYGETSFPTSSGLDVTFNSYQWGGGSADGIAFMLAAVDPANPAAPATMGPGGGSLGYSPAGSVRGLANAYLGVGLDVFGNFSSTGFQGAGCPAVPNITNPAPGAMVVRGPGNLSTGYCGLTTTSDGTLASKLVLRAATRQASVVPVQVLVNPTGSSFTSASGVSVNAGSYKVVATPVGQTAKTLTGALPVVPAGLYPSTSWLNTGGSPKQLAFGFVGSTGSVTDAHEISNVKVLTFNPVPQLAVNTTGYAATTSQPGNPVTYKVTASVLAGADETSPISVTQTVPTGVVPVGAYGTGWLCAPPTGRTITCTTSGSSFSNGTALPAITVVAIVTAANVSSSVIQSGSTVRASSADGNPGTDSLASAGALPSTPSSVTVNPAIGPVAGGGTVIVGGTNIAAATAIEIGTTAEQQAATPVVLLPCAAPVFTNCFAPIGGSLTIYSMPARASAATVSVTVVTAGVASAGSYVYASSPATPATPVATAGITSASLTWIAPAANGSAITGYVVTPYLAGVTQTPLSFDSSATTRNLTGLTAGGSYTFTVAAINAYGTSAASAKSTAVTPYALPGTPSITAVTAGSQAATLTWTAPSGNGSAVSGYVVTPYIAGVAQTPRVFTGTATTQTVTGLTAGTAYTFTVAAQNQAGTGTASAQSSSVTPNVSPSLTFPAPPAGEVGVAYSRLLTVTNGTGPFTWSLSSGTLPAGLTLNASTGLLSGTPTASGSFPFTVQVIDASAQTATKAVTLVIAAAPVMTFVPAAGEVGVAYSQQPVITGGTGPFAWSVTAGSLPAGTTLNSSTGLVSGTPSTAGTSVVTITTTDAFGQVASKTVTFVVVARPAFTAAVPPAGQVGVAYNAPFDVTGGSLPLAWSVSAGSLPSGLTLSTTTGALSGTPSVVGSSPFTVSVVDANGVTATKSVTVVIAAGPLVIVKSANVSSAPVGTVVSYTISVTNTGSSAFTGATLSDPLTGVLDDATYNADVTATAGTVSYTAPTLGWTGNLAAGAVVTIGYSVTVNTPDTGNKALTNTVTSSTVGTNCASGSVDTRCSATVTVPGLTIVKTADVATTTPGSTVHFTIVVTNSGQTSYPAATLTDGLAGVLDDAVYNADGTATSGNVSYTSPGLTWTGALAIGAAVTITYSATVANPDTGNRSLTGTIISPSTGSPCPSGNPAAQCSVTVTVLVPALAITNTASAATATPGTTVTYTVTLANTGQTPYTATSATIALAGALDDATYNNDAAASAGTVVTTGTSSLSWTGNLAVGAAVTITASVTVRNPDPGDRTLTTAVISAAPGSVCPTGNANPACATTVLVRVPELTIAKSANAVTTTPGSVVRYTVSATNTGQTPYTGASLSDTLAGVLDDATYRADAAATTGSVTLSGSTLNWTGDLPTGATATITYSVTVNNPDTGNRSLTGTVTSATPGSNCPAGGTESRCTSGIAVLLPGLTITNNADTATTTPGAVVRYSLTVVNTGQTTYNGIVVGIDISGLVDDAAYNNDAVVSTGSQAVNPDGTISWTLSLAPGASAVSTMSVTVSDPVSGDKTLRTEIVSNAPGSPCFTGSTAAGCRSVVTVLVPGLVITKTADTSTAVPGGTVNYTITVVNTGETAYPTANFADDLTNVLADTTYAGGATATTGTVSYSAPVLSWTGSMAPGASATITYSVQVRDPDPGDKYLTNTVVSSAVGGNCAAGSVDPRCTAAVTVLIPGLTIATTAGAATTTPGATIAYTVTVTNSGATVYNGATFTDSLAGILDDAVYNGDVSADSGTASVGSASLTWTGNLAVGATATITYSVTVRAQDVGDDLLTSVVTSSSSGSNCAAGSADGRCGLIVPVARLVLAYGGGDRTTTPGSVLTIPATYTNTGQVPYVGIVVATLALDAADDVLPGGDQTASSGTLVLGEAGITWTGNIPIGGVVTLSATLTVKNPDPGDRMFTFTTQSSAPGANCAAGSADTLCAVHVTVLVPELTISKTANITATVPGGSVGYTITVHNTGETTYTDASLTDPLIGLLDDADYDGNATATTGVISFSGNVLSWTGSLAPGASATITYSVTAHTPGTGDKTMVNPVSSTAVGSTCPPASGNTACRSTVVVLTPVLTIVQTADLTNATLGTTVTYTVKVTNSGQTSYPAAAFTDSLTGVTDDATVGTLTATSGTVSYTSGLLSWSGALTPGASATISYTAAITNPASGDRVMSATAVSSATGNNCAQGTADTRCTATVLITDSVSLTFTKTADVAAAATGSLVHYTVSVTNSDTSPTAAEFTDPLGGVLDDATYGADLTASAGTAVYTEPDITWSGTVPASSTITVTYSVTVRNSLAGDEILRGTVVSASLPESDNCVEGSTDPRCASVVPVAALLIEQHYTEPSTTPGSLVHLTATFTNAGQLPYTGIAVSSPSADTVDDAIPTGDQVASSGTLILSATAITWTGNIPIGGVVTVTGTLTVKNPDPGDKLVTGTLVSVALGANCPPGGADPRCTAALPVLLPGLTITKTSDSGFVVPGGIAGYTITVHNTGETAYTSATVTDMLSGVLDDATYNGDATTTAGAVSVSAAALTWIGDLAVNATATITYSVTARTPAVGDKTMVNAVSSTAVGSTCPPASGNTACRSTLAVLTPALTFTSVSNVATSVPGGTVTYTVTATDTGQLPYPAAGFSVALGDVLDDATYTGGIAASTGTAAITGQSLTWTGALSQGETVTVTYSVTVGRPVPGNFRLNQTVVSSEQGSTCPVAGTDPRCSTSVAIAGLHIVNAADVAETTPTSVVRNTVTFTNVGQVPYVGISLSDSFAGSLDDATYNGDATATSGSLVLVTGTGQIVWSGDLAVGATVIVTGSLTVNNPDPGNKLMTTVVTTSAPGANCPAPACATSVAVLTPGLTIGKTADTVTTTPGGLVGYTITVTNSGETPYAAATVRDSLVSVLTDAAYTGDAGATSGTVSFTSPTLTWIGALAVDESVVISYSVRVDSPDLGDKHLVNAVESGDLGSSCPIGGTGSSCTTTVVVLVPALDIAVSADSTTTVPGGVVGYTVVVHNSGQTGYLGASVTTALTGVLDDAVYAGGATTNVGTVTFGASALSWTGDLAAGETATISYTVTVADPDPGDKLLTTSVSSPAPGSTCSAAAPCVHTVTVEIPGLAVSTTTSVTTATPGDKVVFTIALANTGQTDYTGTTADSGLADVLDDASFDGIITASIGIATYTAPNLSWSGTLHVGDTAVITYSVTVRNPDPGDKTLSATVVAPAAGSTCQATSDDPACTASVTVLVPGLSIVKSASEPTTTPGSVVGYTVIVTNSGQTAYLGAVVDDSLSGVLPDSDYNGDATVTGGGTLGYSGSTLRWTGDLLIGATATITYSITVHDPDTGDKQMTNTVTSSTPGSTCLPGGEALECTAVVRVLVPALLITKTADTASVTAGDAVHYTVTLTNSGETAYAPAKFTDPLDDVLDDADYTGDATATGGDLDYTGTTLAWTGALALGATATITFSVTTRYPATGDRTLVNSVVSASPGANCPGADPRCATAVTVLVPALTITKSADTEAVVAGGTVRYTISATNSGQVDYPVVTLTDSLAGVSGDAVYNGDATATTGTTTYSDGTVGWSGGLPRGATVVVMFSIAVAVNGTGEGILTNTVVSATPGSTCAADVTEPACSTSTTVTARSIVLTGLTPSFSLTGLPGSTIGSDGTVTMTVTTNSPGGYFVTVRATTSGLSGATAGNTATIPIDRLDVRESGTGPFVPLSADDALVVHRQDGPSAPGGDAVSNDYQIRIPFVPSDNYSATLEYIVSAQ